jgi:hypothetical protein
VTPAPERLRLAGALLAAVCALGCQSEPAPGPVHWQTGRRAEVTPDGLRRIVTYRVSSAWLRPGASFAGYRKVLIAPVTITYARPPRAAPLTDGDGRGNYPLTPAQMDRMRRMLREALEAEFADSAFEVVAEPASDVLRVTVHIVDFEVNTPPETGRNRVYVSVAGEMTGILDLADSGTGISLGRIADRRRIAPGGSGLAPSRGGESEWFEIRSIFRDWAGLLREALDELVTAGPLPQPAGPDPQGSRSRPAAGAGGEMTYP